MKKTSNHPFHVAFFGDADVNKKNSSFIDAYDTAQLVAKNKYTIVNGGGPGIMLASTLGAASVHGRAKAVVIDKKYQPSAHYEGQNLENLSQASRIYFLRSYQGRLNKLIKLSDAYVIFYGGTGTLAEMAYVWSKAKFDYPHHQPIIFFGKKWRKIIQTLSKELNFQQIEQKICHFANTPDQVLEILKEYSKKI